MTHIISYARIRSFVKQHPDSGTSLNAWFQLVSKHNFANYNELKTLSPSADVVKNDKGVSLTVFNIHGNKYRLIAAIHYNRNKLYIRDILRHEDYNKDKWKT
ncbi:MAG: type II toxin-antitoxin system HigB family toxin [Gammaproteobacteria bacterium]|nr:type II toxin-antitoxin system HigB family toxin [Gammaproteobacteria bacterium]